MPASEGVQSYLNRGRAAIATSLSLSDDAFGTRSPFEDPDFGLGTSLVTARAGRLDTKIEVSDAEPGTIVRIVHA